MSVTKHRQQLLERVFTDVIGPFQNASMGISKYLFTLMGDYSRYSMVSFVQSKDRVAEVVKDMTPTPEYAAKKSSSFVSAFDRKIFCSSDPMEVANTKVVYSWVGCKIEVLYTESRCYISRNPMVRPSA